MAPSVIVDDAVPSLYYYGSQWKTETDDAASYNRSRTTCHTEVPYTGSAPSLDLTFSGTTFSLYGPSAAETKFNYSIDGTNLRQATFAASASASPNRTSGVLLWDLDLRSSDSTFHTLKIVPVSGQFTFDYILYTPASSVILQGESLILNDDDSMLKYSSGWSQHVAIDGASGIPYQGSLASSSTNGSTVEVAFEGSTISVYNFLVREAGVLNASFFVDDTSGSSSKLFDGHQTTDKYAYSQLVFHQDLIPGKHKLKIVVDEVTESQKFYLDAIVFEGTRDTIFLPPTSSGNTSSSHGGLSTNAVTAIIVTCILVFIFGTALWSWIRKRRGLDVSDSDSEAPASHAVRPQQPLIFVVPQQGPPSQYPFQGSLDPQVHQYQPLNPSPTPPNNGPYSLAPDPRLFPQEQHHPPLRNYWYNQGGPHGSHEHVPSIASNSGLAPIPNSGASRPQTPFEVHHSSPPASVDHARSSSLDLDKPIVLAPIPPPPTSTPSVSGPRMTDDNGAEVLDGRDDSADLRTPFAIYGTGLRESAPEMEPANRLVDARSPPPAYSIVGTADQLTGR